MNEGDSDKGCYFVAMSRKSRALPPSPFRRFNSSPEIIRRVVLMYVRFPLSLRNVEDLLFERGIDICHETVRLWWNRFGPLFASDIRRQRVSRMRGLPAIGSGMRMKCM
jgi:putative transposase